MASRALVAISLVLYYSVGAGAAENFIAPEGVTILSEQEIRDRVIGNTAQGSDWTEYYKPGGVISGRSPNYYTGKWTVSGSVMCYDYDGPDYDTCSILSIKDGVISFYDLKGKFKGTGKLLVGSGANL